MLTVVVGMPLRNSSGTCISGWIVPGVVEQPAIAALTATAIAAQIRDIAPLGRIPRLGIYTGHRSCAVNLGPTDGRKNNTCLDLELRRAFESKLKASLVYILRRSRASGAPGSGQVNDL